MRAVCGAAALLAVTGSGLAAAEEKKKETTVGVSVDASILLGFGLSVGTGLGDRFNARLAHHFFSYEDEIEGDEGDGDYEVELDLKTTALLFDWHPFKGAFRLTAGLMNNGNELNLTGKAKTGATYDVGDCSFESDPNDPLRINGAVDFKSTAPYLGLGWGGNMNAEPGFFATFDIGVLFSGAPDSDLEGHGSARNANAAEPQCGDPVVYQDVSSYPEFQQAVRDGEAEADEEAEDYKLWPNIAFGIGWRF